MTDNKREADDAEPKVLIPAALLQDLIDDVTDYENQGGFKPVECTWRANLLDSARAALSGCADGGKGEAFPYQKTFDAIAAATTVAGGHIAISVAKFKEAFGTAPQAECAPIAPRADAESIQNEYYGRGREIGYREGIAAASRADAAPNPSDKQEADDALETLVAVLNAISYTEEFAEAHPTLKVSEGVKLFLAQSAEQDRIDAFDVALNALHDYQSNWDTGLPAEHAQSERIQMECAVEAVREALNEAKGASK